MTIKVKNTSTSYNVQAATLEDAWAWAKGVADESGLPVSNFSAYKYTQKFNNKTQKYEDQTPYYAVTLILKNETATGDDVEVLSV